MELFDSLYSVSSRVFKSDLELEVLRYTNKLSSDAHKQVSTSKIIFVKLACGKGRHSCYNFCLVYVCACIQISPGPDFYIHAWISKKFGTVVVLAEEKCHLKHFFR